jgi:kanamycin kinase
MVAGRPTGAVDLPELVGEVAGGRPTQAVWENELGGLTFQIGHGPDRCFAKWDRIDRADQLAAEAERCDWAGSYISVPEVLELRRADDQVCLVTAPLEGENAVADRWKAEPARAVAVLGSSLRILHETLPVDRCPFDWSAEYRISIATGPELVADVPPVDRLVVCHGDACAPNTVLRDDGTVSGHVDLAFLGVADRWADLAVGLRSLGWNYGPGWEAAYLDAYGIDPDPERGRYYQLLCDLGP